LPNLLWPPLIASVPTVASTAGVAAAVTPSLQQAGNPLGVSSESGWHTFGQKTSASFADRCCTNDYYALNATPATNHDVVSSWQRFDPRDVIGHSNSSGGKVTPN